MKNQKIFESLFVRRLPLLFVAVLLAGLALAITLVPLARADTTIYVRPGGDDIDCKGTVNLDYSPAVAPDCAVKTLQKAFDLAASNGAVIYTDGSFSTTFLVGKGIGAAATTMSISKSDSPDPVDVGGPLIYTIVVTNTGAASATQVAVVDSLPPGVVSYVDGTATVSNGGTCTFDALSFNITCNLGTLLANQSVVVTVPVTPTAAGLIENVAIVKSPDLGGLQPTVKETTLFSGTTNLSISKSDSPDPVFVGSLLSYTIIVTNSGPHAAAVVTVTDNLPTNTTFVSATPSQGTNPCPESGGVVTCNLGLLGVNQSATITIVVIPNVEGVITNTAVVTPSGFDDDTSDNEATEDTKVILGTDVYLPIILKNASGPTAQLSWLHKNEDRVSDADGAAGLNTDTINDGAFLATVNVGAGSKTVNYARFESTQGYVWDTLDGNGIRVLGVFDGNTLLNDPDGTIDGMVVNGQISVSIYAADDAAGTRFPTDTYIYTLTVFFDDGTSVSAQATIPSSPPPPPPPTNLAYVSDVAADIKTNQIFIASPRYNRVYVIDGSDDSLTRTVSVGNGPTGLTVLSATVLTENKVFVAHQYGTNFYRPGVKAFGVNQPASHDTSDGGYVGVVPIKIAANGSNNSRVYVSNYVDHLAVLDGASGPFEDRLGWVVQKGYQGAYGIDTSSVTKRAYLATRDTGELVVFDGNNDRLLGSGYIPTHVKPPQACSLWSVAVNPTTGHVFVPCPQLSQVFVLAENQISVLDLETLGVLENRNGQLALVVSPAAAPWIAEITVTGGANLGEEGIAVDTSTGYVFITNASNDTLVILQDGATPSYVTTVTVGDQPQGVALNRITQKVYVGNTGDNTVTVLNAVPPFSLTKVITLTP